MEKSKEISYFQQFKIWWTVISSDLPVYRVTYRDGKRTYPLHYLEAKGLAEVFDGKLWTDWEYARKIITGDTLS